MQQPQQPQLTPAPPPSIPAPPAVSATASTRRPTQPSSARPQPQALHPLLVNARVTSSTAASLLQQLDERRREHVHAKQYRKAQEVVDAMHAVALHQGRHCQREIRARSARRSGARQGLDDQQRQQCFAFTQLWEDRLQEFDTKAEQLVNDTKRRHNAEYNEMETLMRGELASRKVHFSTRAMRLREALEKLVALKQYKEADVVQSSLSEMEKAETLKHEEMLSKQFASRTRQLKQKFSKELQVIQQRVRAERDTLVVQRRCDYETLLQKHVNAANELEQKEKIHVTSDAKNIQKQIDLLLTCPTRSTLPAVHTRSASASSAR